MCERPSHLNLKFAASVVFDAATEAFDGGAAGGGGLGPLAGRGSFVGGGGEGRAERDFSAVPARARGEPGGGGRRAVAGPGRTPGPPGFARRGVVGGGVVPGAMASPPLGDLAGAPLEDGEDRPGPGAPLALAAARAGGEGARRTARGAGARGIVGAPLSHARPHRPARRGAGAGLALACLVDT